MKVRHVDFSPDEFLAGTLGMSNEIVGAYWRLCSYMYSVGGPIRENSRAILDLLKVSETEWNRIRDELIDLEKLQRCRGGMIINSRVKNELGRASARVKKSSAAGKLGGRPKNVRPENTETINELEKGTGSFSEKPSLTINHQPSPLLESAYADSLTITDPPGHDPSGRQPQSQDAKALFAEWWQHVPRKASRGQAEKAYRAALKTADPQTLMAGVLRWASEATSQDPRYVKHPATWLNGQCWLDEPTLNGVFANGSDGSRKRHPSAHETLASVGHELADQLRDRPPNQRLG